MLLGYSLVSAVRKHLFLLTTVHYIALVEPRYTSISRSQLPFGGTPFAVFLFQFYLAFIFNPLTTIVVLIVFIDGFIKPHTPGSLREPAPTYLFPSNWLTLPLSFGLLMSPWGGHSVFPNIYRDMRHPQKFKKAVEVTFTFTVSPSRLLSQNCL